MYNYEPLADPERHVRLAILQPGVFDDPLCITFELRRLGTEGLDYEALSYAWGSSENPSVVYIGLDKQEPLAITRSLDVALRHLRPEAHCRVMWVDAVCIDQNSIREKNHQVASMGRIYSGAACVLIWLGRERDESDIAMGLIEHIGSCVQVNFKTTTLQPADHCAESERHFGDIGVPLPYRNAAFDPVLHLLERPYFKRVWIRQEIAHAKHASLHCGRSRISFENFRKTIACILYKGYPADCVSDGYLPVLFKARSQIYAFCTAMPGVSIWMQFRGILGDAQCQDPRDRVYALLGLLSPTQPLHDLKPDYSVTTEKLYEHVASSMVAQGQSLCLLQHCYLTSRTLDIPSWAPDWTTPLPHAYQRCRWSACGWLTSGCGIMDQARLRVNGVAISRVKEVIENTLTADKSYYEDCETVVTLLRCLKPEEEGLEAQGWTRRRWADMLCNIATGHQFQEAEKPHNESLLKFDQFVDVVETICFTNVKATELLARTDLEVWQTIGIFRFAWHGFVFIKCSDGRVGLAYPGVQQGDLVSVLISCQYPMVLRPCPRNKGNVPQLWQVVCSAMAGELMKGQAIYSREAMLQRQAMRLQRQAATDSENIDRQSVGMYDKTSGKISTDPAELLTEMGIKVESYQRDPHRLEVVPETLRAFGVNLQQFILV